jgi:copper(I)-binding protein
MNRLTFALVTLALSTTAFAHDYKAGEIKIGHPWARATAPTATVGGGYLVVDNAGKADDTLLAVKAGVSAKVELHTHMMENGVAKMREVAKIAAPAGTKVMLAPGGYHLMFIDLKAPLKAGDKFPATLVFEKAGEVKVEFKVEPMDYKVVGGDEHKH